MSIPTNSTSENLEIIAFTEAKAALAAFYEKRGIAGISELRNRCDDSTSFMNCENEALAKEFLLMENNGFIHDLTKEIIKKYVIKNVDGAYVLSIEQLNKTTYKDFDKINKIFDSLNDLFKSNRPLLATLILDLVNKCKDPSNQLFGINKKALEELRFINPDGSLDNIVRKVVLTCIERKGLTEFHLVKADLNRIVDYQLPSPKNEIHSFSSQNYATSIPPGNMTSLSGLIAMTSLPSPSPLSQRVNTLPSLSMEKKHELETKFSALIRGWIDESPLKPKPTFSRVLFNSNLMHIDIFNAQNQEKIHNLVMQRLKEKNIDANLVTLSSYLPPQIQINSPWENFIRFVENPLQPF